MTKKDQPLLPPKVEKCETHNRFNEEYSKWLRLTACDLQDFSDPKTFPWFLTGYHMVKVEDYLTSAMLGVGAIDDGQSDISKFPDCYAKLGKFKSENVEKWVKALKDAFDARSSQRHSMQLDFVHQAAIATGQCLVGSNLFLKQKPLGWNPLGSKLCSLARRMILQLMISFDVQEGSADKGQAAHKWTPFAHQLKQLGKKDQETLEGERRHLMQLRPSTTESLTAVIKSMTQMQAKMKDFASTEGSSKAQAEQRVAAGCSIQRTSDELGKELERAKSCEAVYRFGLEGKPISRHPYYLGGFGFVDLTSVRDSLKSLLSSEIKMQDMTAASSGTGMTTKQGLIILDDVRHLHPRVLFLIRNPTESQSSDPSRAEKDFMTMLWTDAPSIGCIVWIYEGAMTYGNWEGEDQKIKVIHLKQAKVKLPPADKPQKANSVKFTDETSVETALEGIMAKAERCLEDRVQDGYKTINNAKAFVLDKVQEFLDQRSKNENYAPDEFYRYALQQTRNIKVEPEWGDEGKRFLAPLQLPCRTMLNHSPFFVTLFESEPFSQKEKETVDESNKVNELETRTFLKSILRTQIAQRAKGLGNDLYEKVVQKWIVILIGNYFGISIGKLEDLIKKHAPNAADQFKQDSATAASFLMRDNFVCMYMGGTVLACAPLLDSMLGSRLVIPPRLIGPSQSAASPWSASSWPASFFPSQAFGQPALGQPALASQPLAGYAAQPPAAVATTYGQQRWQQPEVDIQFQSRPGPPAQPPVVHIEDQSGRAAPTHEEYDKNLEFAAKFFSGMQQQRQTLKNNTEEVSIKDRLNQVHEHLATMFTQGDGVSVMKNLITEVVTLIRTALNPQQKDLMHLFKARMQSQYWRAGKDPLMFTESELQEEDRTNPARFADALDELLDVVHAKIAKEMKIPEKRPRHSLMLNVDLFFSPSTAGNRRVRRTLKLEDREEAMSFLSKVFTFIHVLESLAIPNDHDDHKIMFRVGTALQTNKLADPTSRDKDVLKLKSRIGCAYMAMKLHTSDEPKTGEAPAPGDEPAPGPGDSEVPPSEDRKQRSNQLVRCIFTGMESVGKSTLINLLIDPTGDKGKPMPTGNGQCTQSITLVKHGHGDLLYVEDPEDGALKMVTGPAGKLLEAMNANAAQKVRSKALKKVTLETPLSRRITPFKTGRRNMELVDVPGIRENTELDTAFALGVGTCMVICCDDATLLRQECTSGTNLPRLKGLYANMVSPLPILVAVTKPSSDRIYTYDKSYFLI